MQTQPIQSISPYAEATVAQQQQGMYGGPEHAMDAEEHALDSPKKKSMMEKVKDKAMDKAKKLKTKIKKPKSADTADDNGESSDSDDSEDESGSNPHQQVGGQGGEEREVVVTPGLKDESFEAIPDPHVGGATKGTTGVEQRFGHMSLGEKPDSTKLQEEVPCAPGVTPYLASHNQDQNPASDDSAFVYTPISEENASEEKPQPQQKPLEDSISEIGAATAVTAPEGALGVGSLSDSGIVDSRGVDTSGGEGSTLEQAEEKTVEGEDEPLKTSEISNPSIAERAANLKDTIAAKLGYASSKNSTGGGDNHTADEAEKRGEGEGVEVENKSYTQKAYDAAYGAKDAIATKLGYGGTVTTQTPTAQDEDKTYTQKAYDAAYSAKDTVMAKLGYGGSTTTEGEERSFMQDAKDAVASKLSYASTERSASTEGSEEQNVPASTAALFHPGDEDRALSELITEKMSTGATAVKETLMRPFGAAKSAPTTPTATPPPPAAAPFAEGADHSGRHDVIESGEEKPGIVEKVTGAVSSLLGTSGSGKKRVDEATGKASEDSQAAGSL